MKVAKAVTQHHDDDPHEGLGRGWAGIVFLYLSDGIDM